MKRIAYLLGLLLLMALTVVLCVLLWTTAVEIAVKIIVSIIGILITLFIFKIITNINNKYIESFDKEEDKLVPKFEEETPKKLILCPKCYQAFDGEVCFHCGYKRNIK